MKTILVPIDFSAGTNHVLDKAIALARDLKGRLIVLHVVQPPLTTDPDAASQMSTAYIQFASKLAASRLLALQRQLAKKSITVATHYVVEAPGRAIVEQAERFHANFIVIGSHGHGGLYELVVGSTTSRVIKRAPCPVVVVPLARNRKRR